MLRRAKIISEGVQSKIVNISTYLAHINWFSLAGKGQTTKSFSLCLVVVLVKISGTQLKLLSVTILISTVLAVGYPTFSISCTELLKYQLPSRLFDCLY